MNEKVRARIDSLKPLLKDTVPGVRIAAAQAIEKLEGFSSTEEILQALKTGDIGTRVASIYALGEIGGEAVLPPLIYCAGRQEADIRSAAVAVLGRLALPEAMPVLVERLDDPSSAVQARAISALSNYHASREVLQKLRVFINASDGALEAEAALTLAKLKDIASLDQICVLLSSPHASTRQAAATALSLIPLQ
ncbi:MAG: HEAT repeat domain-containing protein [Deltaproteobacteria bacterium]|nr:HEAT repeat domain-containing protein [Deltaproteobacteria bacterium]